MQFCNLTIVSHSLAKKIGRQNANVVGLGGEVHGRGHLRQIKNFAKLNLVYVGSLGGRDLDFVLRAISGSTRQKDIFLTIIGSFETAQGMELVRLATKLGLNQSVKFEGYLKGELLESALKDSNIGLVHVPPSPFYTCQPSTKLYEYWAHGLPVLASDYGFDEQEIPLKSGFVYDYKIESLQKLFEQILDSDNAFDYELISKLATRYSWESVVYNQLVPLLQTLED
jgi:glycosyltransferase involved in cell wall biosynthesis